ncbi:MAG: hypothetical protein A2469_04745 [Candidatus Magasanikbacteria bacterium RIFOXYC2_FULL_40_16]|uniref:MgtC/SapB/SrpB/YhiD N-terminal domain-containing protein n=3 Tax=Candidatus Magasanikiibacteriota TaxID=1752731 RepID=A0A1F6ND87_9BACT|nr:MAG: hypothetical protein A3K03_03200 [Bdellovibrionales bacterium RIFOXYD1_FULL_44_7]OGH79428.1 MAG: hypothetical protein A2224_00490 [Candidatus Magasanikbacteria bacterium RIFOXYA2_FULL_40_20]OGH81907.1 MAG: hypothetical protein A2373_04295 [Candidatus Magasanikbacteria bacterium RIFOXYB1_FULL_40_15]OGH87333.1 MAG: hypothetical protein A2206_02040 [Candidatus Magasanikbacteria bacterium RIFOXYA1_FULL_40_8]OGH89343.1 MAG: hypothetical protein A2469_04745 [Candidatus Magasanikbacteria bacte
MEFLIFSGQLILSSGLGSILGWQRHKIGKSAGARTFAMVAFGSTLFTLLSLSVANEPSRIAAQILTGIGFIGAGTIIHKKESVEGLTTAAGLWASAAIGMAVGFGWYIQAIIAMVLMFAILALKPDYK